MDEIDRKIIAKLQEDGRASLEELAKETGYTNMGTKKRLQKLLDKGIIKISANLNPIELNLLPAIVLMEMESAESLQNLIDKYKSCPRIVHIFKTMGGYNLIAIVVAENQDTLECIAIEKCSIRSSPGVRRSEFYPISESMYSSFLDMQQTFVNKTFDNPPCKVDCKSCSRRLTKKCAGCPLTADYKGSLR
jgi:DNA-binding Lrp family transcriptional regulator